MHGLMDVTLHSGKRGLVDAGILSRVYQSISLSASCINYLNNLPFPTFEELYEDYVSKFLEEKTQMTKKQIEQTLFEINVDEFDVERGYRPEMYGISKEAEFYNALLVYNLTFVFKGQIINEPIKEVW